MKLLLGPMLYAKEQTSTDTWTFSVNLYLDTASPPPLRLRFLDASGRELFATDQATAVADLTTLPKVRDGKNQERDVSGVVWRWEVALTRTDACQRVSYRFEPTTPTPGWTLAEVKDILVPERGASPRIAFFSCNGASSPKLWNGLEEPLALWHEMLRQQEEPRDGAGFHLLIGGGDQVYADSLWDKVSELREFQELSRSKRLTQPLADGLDRRLVSEFALLYLERWGEGSGIGAMLARVPGLYTWDDHDIFDGWGSHEELQGTPWFKAVYNAAAITFEAFQLGGLRADAGTQRQADDDTGPARHYFQTACFPATDCDLDVVMLDLRSGRTSRILPNKKLEHVIMSRAQWQALDAWRERHAGHAHAGKKARHVLLVSSVPLVHLRFGSHVELASRGRELHDDLLDQWESSVHRGERTRMLMDLFSLAKQSCCAVTVVSGDVHVAARALIRSRNPEHLLEGKPETTIDQVTSSGIVHPPPTAMEFLGIRMLSKDGVEDLPSFLQTEMLPVGPDLYLRERNWLSLRVEPSKVTPPRPKLWVRWEAEQTSVSMEVVVEPPALPPAFPLPPAPPPPPKPGFVP